MSAFERLEHLMQHSGHPDEGRLDLQAAVAAEPNRASFHSYLGKAFSASGKSQPAEHD